MLRSLPQRKIIFTNATVEHALNVLTILGCADLFECIIDVRAVDFISKPDPRAYSRILELIGARGDECVLIEDNARNLRPAKALGMTMGFQAIYADYEDGSGRDRFRYDVTSAGPVLGLILRF